jgi:hypothetical protein
MAPDQGARPQSKMRPRSSRLEVESISLPPGSATSKGLILTKLIFCDFFWKPLLLLSNNVDLNHFMAHPELET